MNDTLPPWLRDYITKRIAHLQNSRCFNRGILIAELQRILDQEEH